MHILIATTVLTPHLYRQPPPIWRTPPPFLQKNLEALLSFHDFSKISIPCNKGGGGGKGGRGSHYKYCYLLSPILEVAFREFSFSSILNSQVDICLKRKHPFFFCISRLSFTCLKSTIETLEQVVKYFQSYWRCSGVFIVNFKHIWLLVLVFLLLTLNM